MIAMINASGTTMRIVTSGDPVIGASRSGLPPNGSVATMVTKGATSGATITAPAAMITASSNMGVIRVPKVGIWAGEDMARADIPKAGPNMSNTGLITASSNTGAIRAPEIGTWARADMARADMARADMARADMARAGLNMSNAVDASMAGMVAMRAANIAAADMRADMIPWEAGPA